MRGAGAASEQVGAIATAGSSGQSRVRRALGRNRIRRVLNRNRVLVIALLGVGGVVALLTGLAMAAGEWMPAVGILEDKNRPKGRFGAASTYDESMGNTVVFGGFVGSTGTPGTVPGPSTVTAPPIANDNQTYLFKFQGGWSSRDTVNRPSARGFASMAYDGARRNVVLFGGAPYNTNNVSGETWIWDADGEGWTLQNPPEPRPDPRQNAGMVYDPHRKVVMMFGGRGADGKPMNDTWTWNGSRWKVVPRSEEDPSPRHSAAMAYDLCRAQAVMFGGVGLAKNNLVSQPFETWTWDGAKWTQQSPRVSPPPRIGASMAYSPRTGNLLLYGGLYTNEAGVATAAIDDDVWRWIPDAPTPGGSTGWERMNSDATTVAEYSAITAFDIFLPKAQPPPRAYATFGHVHDNPGGFGSMFQLYGGTPSAAFPTTGSGLDNSTSAARAVQVAYGDQFYFGDRGIYTGTDQDIVFLVGLASNTPLERRCKNPVPIPSDDLAGEVTAPEGPKSEVREGMREIGQFPVLMGTDWPDGSRDTHIGLATNNVRPNPNYTPAPPCPNRSGYQVNTENGSKTHLVTDPKRNRIYQFFVCDPFRGYNGQNQTNPKVYNLLIEAYHGTTLEPLGRALIPVVSEYAVLPPVHDAHQGRFLIRDYNASFTAQELTVVQQDLIEKNVNPVVDKINLAGTPIFDLKYLFNHPKTGGLKAFFYVPAGGATAGPPPSQGTPPKLAQWDVMTRREDWRVEIPASCTGLTFTMRSNDHAYLVCSQASGQYAVGRVPITQNADGSETPGVASEFSSGPTWVYEAWGDPQSERIVLKSRPNDGSLTVWVFDGKTSRWVGRTGIGKESSSRWGFDLEAGRLYVHIQDKVEYADRTQGGVKMIDTRLTPISQALVFPQFATPPGAAIAFLPAGPGIPRRVFIRRAEGTVKKYPNGETVKFTNEMFYTILADDVPVPKLADLSERDALTIPVAETPGKTEVSFDAEGSGYGIRLRSVGGIWTATGRPLQQVQQDAIDGAVNGSSLGTGYLPPACIFPDRELMAGWVPQARLSDLDALATSSGLEVDSNSKIDLKGPFSRCNPTASASNFPASIKVVFDLLWPLKLMVESQANEVVGSGVTAEAGQQSGATTDHLDTPLGTLDVFKDASGKPTGATATTTSSSWDSHFKTVECVGDALKTYQATVGNIYGSSKCKQTEGLVDASARGSATGVGPLAEEITKQGFSVGEGYSNVIVSRDSEKGVVVTSTAVALGIQIPGLSIDRVETKAVAWSNGRPGDERASFIRKICGVITPDYSNGKCLSSGEQQQMVDNWNKGWGINSKMFLPKPDPDYYQGSPGGYIAGVIKPVADEVEDQLFAKDLLKEVPGLVIVFYKDSQVHGNARQSLQLAAVRAIAGFGVQCNPDYLYSPQTNTTPATCVLIPEDLPEEEYFEEGEDEFFEEEESELDGEWISADALGPTGPSLGSRIGKLLENLPVIRQLPIRQIAEALLAGSVWWLLGLPLFLASRRFALSQWRTN